MDYRRYICWDLEAADICLYGIFGHEMFNEDVRTWDLGLGLYGCILENNIWCVG